VGQSYTMLKLKLNYVRAMSPKLREVRCKEKLIDLSTQNATPE
jgi:hypothetical protein